MVNTVARLKVRGKNFEIVVDLDSALKLKEGQGSIHETLAIDAIFTDSKKGMHASEQDMKEAFGTTDLYAIAERIVKEGEILLPAEYREKEREEKIKQVVDFLARHATDPRTGTPHTPERIKRAIEEAGVNIENRPIEEQIPKIIEQLSKVLPIKLEIKKLEIIIPPMYVGKVYGVLQQYKENEEWLDDGSLKCVVAVPTGLQSEFYDKLNKLTDGTAVTKEVKENE